MLKTVLPALIYGSIAIVVIMIVADLLGRRRQRAQVRRRRIRSRAADDAPLSVWANAMSPRADFPPTTFDAEDAEPGGVKRKHSGSAKGGLTPEQVRRPVFDTSGSQPGHGRSDGLVAGGVKAGGSDPLERRQGFVPPHSAADPLEKVAPKVNAHRGKGFNSVRLVSLSGPDQGKSFSVVGAGAVIGRHPSCQIVIGDRRVSGRHAWLGIALGKVILRDLESTNGTLINVHPHRVIGETELHAGDTICFGGHKGVEFNLLID
jgi:hypothetical protein